MSGQDPDGITISEWCDTAWAYILRQTPVMSSPVEYRDTLWEALYIGELSPETKARIAENQAKAAKSKPKDRKPPPPPRSAVRELEALVEQAAALRSQRQAAK